MSPREVPPRYERTNETIRRGETPGQETHRKQRQTLAEREHDTYPNRTRYVAHIQPAPMEAERGGRVKITTRRKNMKQKTTRITDHLPFFSRFKQDDFPPEDEPIPDPPTPNSTSLASNVLRGTNWDLSPSATACQGRAPESPAKQRRDRRMRICFTPEELSEVKRQAREAGTDCSKYIRAKLSAAKVTPVSHVSPALADELRRVGRRFNDILAKADAAGFIDVPELHKALCELQTVLEKINAVYSMKEGSNDE